MSALVYSQAVTETGEPVGVIEHVTFLDAYATRPCSWALILGDDEVRFTSPRHDQEVTGKVLYGSRYHYGIRVMWIHPPKDEEDPGVELETVDPADLTLVCTADIPAHRAAHPAWRWD